MHHHVIPTVDSFPSLNRKVRKCIHPREIASFGGSVTPSIWKKILFLYVRHVQANPKSVVGSTSLVSSLSEARIRRRHALMVGVYDECV